MDLQELIESGRVKITCSKCGNKFKDKEGTGVCSKCGTPWQLGNAVSSIKAQPKLQKGADPAKRTSGGEVREI